MVCGAYYLVMLYGMAWCVAPTADPMLTLLDTTSHCLTRCRFQQSNSSDYPVSSMDSTYVCTKGGQGKPEVTISLAAAAHQSVTTCPVFLTARKLLSLMAKNEIDLGQQDPSMNYAAVSLYVAMLCLGHFDLNAVCNGALNDTKNISSTHCIERTELN